MRIAFLIRMLMMDAVCGYPENRATLQSQRGADGQEILHPFGRLISAMGEEAMVGHPDAEAACHPPQENRYKKRLPCEEEQRRDRPDMKQRHDNGCYPVNFVFGRLSPFQILQFHIQGGSPFP